MNIQPGVGQGRLYGGWNPNRFGGGGGGGTGGGGSTPQPPPSDGGGNNAPGSFGATPMNFGQPTYPWLMPYQGGFTAGMSPFETGALSGYNQFVQGGMGLDPAGNYLNDVLGGQYLDMNRNPYLQQIQTGMQGIKDYEDQQALSRIGSSMALGGNALSGARLGAESDYMRNSNNQFQALMGQLMNQNYQGERGLMNQAPGQLAGLASTAGQGYSQLFGMGALPRSLQQNDLNAAYNDFLRQTGAMQGEAHYPDQQLLQFLYGGGYRGQYQPLYGQSILDQIAGNLGGSNIDWGSIINSIGGLFGGSGNTTGDNQQYEVSNDGVSLGYDGWESTENIGTDAPATSGPANYWDKNWYANAIAQNAAQQAARANQKAPNTTLPAILTLLLSMLSKTNKSGKAKTQVGGIGPGSSGPGSSSRPGQPQGSYNPNSRFLNPYGNMTNYTDPTTGQVYGPQDPNSGSYDPFSIYDNPYDNMTGYTDPNPGSEVFGPGFDPTGGGLNNLAGGYGGDLYSVFGNDPGGDFGGAEWGGGEGVQFDGRAY